MLFGFWPLAFLALFFVYPLLAMLQRAFDWGVFANTLNDPGVHDVLWFTFWQAAVSALLTVALGMPIACVLGRYEFRGRRIIESLVTVPFILPTVVVAS